MISNEERREVARKLRSLDENIDGVPLMCTKQEHNAICSNCGVEIGEYSVPNYCPNCGRQVVK